LPSPVILHLRDPAHYLVAMGAAGDSVLVADSGAPAWRAMARAELARRATGFGLVLDLPASAEAGRLALEPALADVGTVLGAVSPAEFTLSNRGAGPLGLRVESRSCTCTQVDWQERSLAPGERVVLKVATTPLAAGPFSTEVVLRTTDPTRPRVPLVLCGDWQPGVRLSPSRVVAKVAPGQTVRREVRVSGPAELVVRQAACADPLVEMSQKGVQVVGGRATALLELTLTGAKEPGIRLAELELSVAAPQAIRLVLPLAVETVPFVVVQPAAVAITALPASGETLNLRLDSVDGRPFAVTAVACDGLDARLLSARRQPDGSLLVAVKIAPRQPGLLRSNLALTLDHPGCPSVQVSLVARAAGG